MIRGHCSTHLVRLLSLFLMIGSIAPAEAATDLYVDGYFRLRARLFDNLALNRNAPVTAATETGEVTSDGTTSYFSQRLLLGTELRVNQYLSVHTQLDILPNLIWGTNPVQERFFDDYLEPVGWSQSFGIPADIPLINPRRVWAEVYTPVGRLKLGRTGMEVGAGIFFNAGNDPDSDFGDTADRAQFLTRFGRVWLLLGYDMIYEGTLDRPYDAQAGAAAVAYRSELLSGSFYTYLQSDRSRPDEGEVTVDDTEEPLPANLSMLTWTFDLWGQASVGPVDLELEAILRYGSGDMVLRTIDDDEANIQLVPDATVLQYGGMLRGVYTRGMWKFGLEGGLASGDSDLTDSKFTTLHFDPDYHVGFLLFRVPMPARASLATDESPADVFDTAITGFSVSNAFYFLPSVEAQVFDKLSARLSALGAWTASTNAELNFQKDYGYEIDLDLSSRLFDKLTLGAKGALFFPGGVFGDNREFAFGGELRAVVEF